MTVQEAADRLGVGQSTVYSLCRTRKLGHCRVGLRRGTIRITPEDLDAYLASVRVEPGDVKADPVRRQRKPAIPDILGSGEWRTWEKEKGEALR